MRITPEHVVIEVGNISWGAAIVRSCAATEACFCSLGTCSRSSARSAYFARGEMFWSNDRLEDTLDYRHGENDCLNAGERTYSESSGHAKALHSGFLQSWFRCEDERAIAIFPRSLRLVHSIVGLLQKLCPRHRVIWKDTD